MSFGVNQGEVEWVSHSETSSTVKLPEGLTFRGFDLQTGLVSPYGVLRTLLRGRTLSMTRADFVDIRQFSQDRLFFVVTGDINMSKDLYNVRLPKYPVSVDTRLVSFRKSSFVLESYLTIPGISNVVASLSTNLVCVAMDTRKSIPLPDWWGEKYADFSEKATASNFNTLVYPEKLFCKGFSSHLFALSVKRRDQDSYGHVNTTFYLQYCLDALEHHLCSNDIKCDINNVSLLLKSAKFLHKGESEMGDILHVAFWEDEANPETVCFDITKSGQSIYQSRMQFYGASEVIGTKSKL